MLAFKPAALLATLLASPQLTAAAPTDAFFLGKRGLALPTTDAPYSVSTANLSAAITCKSQLDGSKNVILLVHGTALTAASWQSGPYWNLLPQQVPSFVPCTVNIPHNALADAQVNAEFVAYAINSLAKKSKNGKVAVVGHSQGGGLNIPWASIFWPSARSKISSFVGLAPDFHGTILLPQIACVVETAASLGQGCSTSFIQQEASSHYLAAQEAFLSQAIVPTTAVFTRTDEIVVPQFPDAIASSRLPGSVQFPLQNLEVCGPLHLADHLSMQIDPAAYSIVLQAIQSPTGKADKAKFDRSSCTNFANTDLNFNDAKPTLDYLQTLGTAVLFSEGIYSKTEPPLKSYVARAGFTA